MYTSVLQELDAFFFRTGCSGPTNIRTRLARSTFACKAKQYQKKSQKNFNIFFIVTSHEKLQIHVITILPTGMIGTYGKNLVQCEVFLHFWRCSEVFATFA